MRDLSPMPSALRETWTTGSTAEVAFAITANHGGGYSYRICPADSDLSEECFQKNVLSFVGNTSQVMDEGGKVLATVPAMRTSTATFPPGSHWSKNPIPQEKELRDPALWPFDNYFGRGPFSMSIVDTIEVPAGLAAGHYVLSWRWDAEAVQQVWQSCSDINIIRAATNSSSSQPAPVNASSFSSSTAPYKPSGPVCEGASLGLAVSECTAWTEFYDALIGEHWLNCSKSRLDPCGCNAQGTWGRTITCTNSRNYQHITEIYLGIGNNVTGTIPAIINKFTELKAFDLNTNLVHGTIPSEIGDLPNLVSIWLDHNPLLSGSLPASFAKLDKLEQVELHECNLTGVLPAAAYASWPDCLLGSAFGGFDCPLPAGAETCGASCA